MPRGGKRPGAGAPRGNLNAVKSGRYSKCLHTLALGLALIPEVCGFLTEFNRKQRREQRKAEKIAFMAVKDFLSEMPDANNPLLVYLKQARTKQEIQHAFFN